MRQTRESHTHVRRKGNEISRKKQHMGINSIIALLGGLGAFLFGMKYMGEGP